MDPEEMIYILENTIINNRDLSTALKKCILSNDLEDDCFIFFTLSLTMDFNESIFLINNFLEKILKSTPNDIFSFLILSYTISMLLNNHRPSNSLYDSLLQNLLNILDYPFKQNLSDPMKRISSKRISLVFSANNEEIIKKSFLYENITNHKGGNTLISNETVNNFIHHFKEAFELSLKGGTEKNTTSQLISSLSLSSLSIPFESCNDSLLQLITLLAPGLIMDVLERATFATGISRLPLHLLIPNFSEDNEQLSLILGISNSYKALVKNIPLTNNIPKLPLAPSLLFSLVAMSSNDSISDNIKKYFDSTISQFYSSNDLLEMIILLFDVTLEQQQFSSSSSSPSSSIKQIIALDRTLGLILDSKGKSIISQLILESFPGIVYYFQNHSWGIGTKTGKELRLYRLILLFISYCSKNDQIHNPDSIKNITSSILKIIYSLPLQSYDNHSDIIDLFDTLKTCYDIIIPLPPFNIIPSISSKKLQNYSENTCITIFNFITQIPSINKVQFGIISIIYFCQNIIESNDNGEEVCLIINYLLQESLEELGMRDIKNKWASSVWNLFSSHMKDLLEPLLSTRYRCERVFNSNGNNNDNGDDHLPPPPPPPPFSPSILPGTLGNLWNLFLKNQTNDPLLRILNGLSIPDQLAKDILSILLFIELIEDDDKSVSGIWKDIYFMITAGDNIDLVIGDVFHLLFEQISIITPALHKKIILKKRSLLKDIYHLIPMEKILLHLASSSSLQKKKMVLRIVEELFSLFNLKDDFIDLNVIVSKSFIGLNLPILESGYILENYSLEQPIMLRDYLMDDLESISKTSMDVNVEFMRILGKDLSYVEGMLKHDDSRSLLAYQELQRWGNNGDDIYLSCGNNYNSYNYIENILLKPSTKTTIKTKNILSQCLSINDEIMETGFKMTLRNLDVNDCSRILFGSKMISNKIPHNQRKTIEFGTNITLLYVNKLRLLKESKMAHLLIRNLKDINSSSSYDWRLDYYEAKIMFENGSFNPALRLLENIFIKDFSISAKIKSKIASLIAKITYKSKAFSDSSVRETFERCIDISTPMINSKVQYLFSLYLDECNGRFNDLNLTYQTIKSFAKTISFDQRYDRIACCRFFTLFFDVGDKASSSSTGGVNSLSSNDMAIIKKITSIMDRVVIKVPMFKFLPNLSQLASKICQCDNLILKNVQEFIVKLLHEYPHTVIWKIINFVLSINGTRKQKYSFIQASSQSNPLTQKLWNEYNKVCKILIDICALSPSNPKDNSINLSKSSLNKINSIDLSLVTTPMSSVIYRNSKDLDDDFVYISEFKSKLDVFPSLQKPKRLMVLCSDGVERSFLCKPKDDLRKDMRFLELASLTNDIIKSGHIITYAALPLNEEAGVIEWIDNTISLRSILFQLYKEKGISIDFAEVRDLQKTKNFSNTFTDVILKKYFILLYINF